MLFLPLSSKARSSRAPSAGGLYLVTAGVVPECSDRIYSTPLCRHVVHDKRHLRLPKFGWRQTEYFPHSSRTDSRLGPVSLHGHCAGGLCYELRDVAPIAWRGRLDGDPTRGQNDQHMILSWLLRELEDRIALSEVIPGEPRLRTLIVNTECLNLIRRKRLLMSKVSSRRYRRSLTILDGIKVFRDTMTHGL